MEVEKIREEMKNLGADSRFHRQLDLLDPTVLQELPITIIGCGGIGSSTAIYAAKMGAHSLSLWDFDSFEIHNLPNQMCRFKDLGKNKAEAVADIIQEFEDIEVEVNEDEFDGEVSPNSVVIMAVDSMKARKAIWDMVRKKPIRCVIDGRMGLTTMNIFSVNPTMKHQVKYFEDTLWADEEVAEIPCTAKATIFTAGGIASVICEMISKIARNEPLPCEILMDTRSYYTKVVNENCVPVIETQPLEDF